jgi:2'-5' RNA ligase
MRLFFAVLLPEEVRDAVARVQMELRASAGDDGIRWVKPEQFHYTLKFLGETPEERVPPAVQAAKLVSAQNAPFTLTLAEIGAFPQPNRPQVLWIGASEGVPLLTRLAESLDSMLVERSFEAETRRFNAHLTLARTKSLDGQRGAARALSAQADEQNRVDKISAFQVQSFALMRSELRPTGPIYTIQETFALTPGRT